MALYHKYRPSALEEIYGNGDTVESLKGLFKKDKNEIPHAFLFHGSSGCGKTTLGRIIASMLNCKGSDFREIDSADFRGVDTVREIRKQSRFKAIESSCRIYLMDEIHKATNEAQNALLKALEDTPSHVYYILCTTDLQKLLPTVKGRCSQYQVNPLNDQQMLKLLRYVVKAENEKLEKKVYLQIVQDSLGQPRNALQILDQTLSTNPEKRLDVAKRSAETQSESIELCRALINRLGWKKISRILNELKNEEPETIRKCVLGYCSSILLKEENDVAGLVMEEMEENFFSSGFPGLVLACYRINKK